jgi:predicted RNA-binding Zn ribbon-like protein
VAPDWPAELPVPVAKAGHPVLEFCNTRAGWGDPEPKEYLLSYAHLAVWAGRAGLPTPPPPRDDPAVLARALRLRDALYAALTGTARRADWAALNREVRRAAGAAELVPQADPPDGAGADHPPAIWRLPDRLGAELPLLAVAGLAADLLTSPLARAVAACPGVGCGWLFLDPHGRRRWCTMAICGNRAKARRHAARTRRPG